MKTDVIKLERISRGRLMSLIKWLGKGIVFQQIDSETKQNIGLNIVRPDESFKGIDLSDYPVKGGVSRLYIDYPVRDPVYAIINNAGDLYDLIVEIRKVLIAIIDNYEEFNVSRYIKLGNLYIKKLEILKDGDIVVYINNICNYE